LASTKRAQSGRRQGKIQRTLATDRPPWYQQPTESDQSFAHFETMRTHALPRPTIHELRAMMGRHSISSLTKWSSDNSWTTRLSAWDQRLAGDITDAIAAVHISDAAETERRMIEHGGKLHRLAEQELDKLVRRSSTELEMVLTPKTILQFLTLAMTMDRTLTPTEAAATTKAMDLGKLTDADLRSLQRMATKVGE